jgi:hypothetical protein
MVDRHALGEPCGERGDLRMDVSEPGGARPPAELLDEVLVNVIETGCHGSTCTKGVGTDPSRDVAGVEEASEDHTFAEGTCNVCRGDVVANGHKTEGYFGIGGVNTVQTVYTVRQGFDRAEVPGSGRVVHGAPTLTILLVIQIQADAFAL